MLKVTVEERFPFYPIRIRSRHNSRTTLEEPVSVVLTCVAGAIATSLAADVVSAS